MPKDENGIDPKAKDGQPKGKTREEQAAEDELAMRRARQEEKERSEEAATGLSDHGKPGRAIDDQPEPDEPTEEELFPAGSIPGDHKVTLKNILPAGKVRKSEAKMRATAVPMLHGLRRYGEYVELLVTVEAGAVNEIPDLEETETSDRRTLVGVKDVQTFRPVHVRSAEGMLTLDQVLDILEREFAIPRSADKVREVFGLEQPKAAAAG